MARQTNPPTAISATLTRAAAVKVLSHQVDAANALIGAGFVDRAKSAAWRNSTIEFLVKCFGRPSGNVERFEDIGGSVRFIKLDPTEEYLNQQRVERLKTEIEFILGCVDQIKQLEVIMSEDAAVSNHPPGDPRKVFVIHGRNTPARNAMFHFLRCIKLDPVDFDELSGRMGGSEFIGNIIRQGMLECRGIIAMFTPDERAILDPRLAYATDEEVEKQRWQARPNVIFEAGMAMGIDARRTILVTVGADVKLFSDAGGRHIVRLNNTNSQRDALIKRLRGMGCQVNTDSGGWYDPALAGDFEACIKPLQQAAQSPAAQQQATPAGIATDLDMLGAETLE